MVLIKKLEKSKKISTLVEFFKLIRLLIPQDLYTPFLDSQCIVQARATLS